MPPVTVAAIQTHFTADRQENIERVTHWIERAAQQGAQIILAPELFQGLYFCQAENDMFFSQARTVDSDPAIAHFQTVAQQLRVVLPISFFEKDNQSYFNSVAIIDADGSLLGTYRKSHIPDGPGYEEKFYFRPGNTGFKVWNTRYATIGVGICWDQWFPECARIMTLQGAQLLFYPTAIGSEPQEPHLNTVKPWQRAMVGHAVCNAIPIIAANRVGVETNLSFYGHSFISNHVGEIIAQLDHQETQCILAQVDLDDIERYRAGFGFFRDRRPELYHLINATD